MPSINEYMGELRQLYAAESHDRLERLRRALRELETAPGDAAALSQLREDFHRLAGSGGSYGVPQISELGRRGEQEVLAVLAEKRAASPDDLERLRSVVDHLQREFTSIGGALAPAPEEPQLARRERAVPTWREPGAKAGEALVVDDDPAVVAALVRFLELEGFAARAARSLSEAHLAIAGRAPDILITDLRLPDGSGHELIRYVRALPEDRHARTVLAVSALNNFKEKLEAIRNGADAHFEKPLSFDRLADRLNLLVEVRRDFRPRVLAVEDDPDQVRCVTATLEAAGCLVRGLQDPLRLESEMIEFRPDLVLLDVVLPGVSGYELARYLRQDPRYGALPVLFVTVQGELESQIASGEAGADDHLVKPVQPELLISAVKTRVHRWRLQRALSNRDGLTHLATRSAVLEAARNLVVRKARAGERPFSWVMIEVDGLGDINRLHGHPAGDRALAFLAALLRRRVRRSDVLGRFGGDEFAAILELSAEEAAEIVERILEEYRLASHGGDLEGTTFQATFSAGVAGLRRDQTLESWLREADEALHEAKRSGRNRVHLFPAVSSPIEEADDAVRSPEEKLRGRAPVPYPILDSGVDDSLDELARLAAEVCGAPIAAISLHPGERQWLRLRDGIVLEAKEAFASAVALLGAELQVVSDTRDDPRWASSPLVKDPPYVRFYAGAMLRTPEGFKLGALSVADLEPRSLSESQTRALLLLAGLATAQLELRQRLKDVARLTAERDRRLALVEEVMPRFKTGTGMFTICAWCLKFRDRSGGWQTLDRLLHLETKITHGICPDCARGSDPRPTPA